MSLKMLCVALLALAACPSTHASPAGRFPTGKNQPCCVAVTETDVSSRIIGDTYHHQHARASCVEAILFTTAKGLICVDPRAEWVSRVIAKMRKE